MAAMEGNLQLLEEYWHMSCVMILFGLQMRKTKVKAAGHNFVPYEKNGYV